MNELPAKPSINPENVGRLGGALMMGVFVIGSALPVLLMVARLDMLSPQEATWNYFMRTPAPIDFTTDILRLAIRVTVTVLCMGANWWFGRQAALKILIEGKNAYYRGMEGVYFAVLTQLVFGFAGLMLNKMVRNLNVMSVLDDLQDYQLPFLLIGGGVLAIVPAIFLGALFTFLLKKFEPVPLP